MKRLVVGTGNQKKLKEIKEILSECNLDIVSLKELEPMPDVIEDADTFEGNAAKKAIETSSFYNCLAVADDSGLEVDYLDGAPGIYSARYAGDHGNDEKNNEKLLSEMTNVPEKKRSARFVCVIAIAEKGELIKTFRGEFEGQIAKSKTGDSGFGYDPIMFIPKLGKTVAQLSPEEKNKISHRYKALVQLADYLTFGQGQSLVPTHKS